MNSNTLLHIDSSGRYEGSITRKVSAELVSQLSTEDASLKIDYKDIASGFSFVSEAWINANFTNADERSKEQKTALSQSDQLVSEVQNSQIVVIGAPIYNFNIPATLKTWIDLIARAGLTFRYTEQGPIGLLDNKKVYIVMASGGVPIGSEMDLASAYLKVVLGFLGLSDITFIDATKPNSLEGI